MPRLLSAVTVLCALNLFAFSRSAHVQAAAAPHTVRVFVQLQGQPAAADPNLKRTSTFTHWHLRFDPSFAPARVYGSALSRYQSQELDYIKAQGIDLHVEYQYHLLFNGFSADIPSNQLDRLKRLVNVTSVVPARRVQPQLDRSVPLTHAPQAWSELGGQSQAGKGVYIADIDTGIDITNPCFRPDGIAAPSLGRRADSQQNLALTNNKVPVIRAFGTHAEVHYSAVDTIGHGTFTGAIEACDANTPTPLGTDISGMAPDAYLMVYNIRPDGDTGDGLDDPDIAAFESALQDGADVVNYSFGSVFGAGDERLDPEVYAINLATRAGLTFVVSAGNAGPTTQTVSTPATADAAISVGASTNSRSISSTVTISGAGVPANLTSIRATQGSHPFYKLVGPAQMVYAGLGRRPGDDSDNPSADDFAGKDLHGKIALIQRGTLLFETKINNAAKAGAIGVLIFNNRFSLNPPGMDVKSATLPAMAMTQSDGKALLSVITTHPDTTAAMNPQKIAVDETPNILSDFSARGYGPGFKIKPDIVAPGQDIYSAAETSTPSGEIYDSTGFTSADGTSFSAPHVAGAVALLLQKHPKWTPAQVKETLTETADTNVLTDPGQNVPPVMDVGAGLLNIANAVSADAQISPASMSLGEVNLANLALIQDRKLTLTDLSNSAGTWNVSVQQLHGTSSLSVTVPATVSVPANGNVDVPVRFTEAQGTDNGDYDGYIFLRRGNESLHVPYFLHIVTKSVAAGSILLLDATTPRLVPEGANAPLPHKDVSAYYEQAVTAIGKTYTYWNDGVLGPPSLDDMKRASAVIVFTSNNLNGYAKENSNYQALDGALNSVEISAIHSYMDGGGRVFITGLTAALSDLVWAQFVLGVEFSGLNEYVDTKGGMSPPQPSAVVESRPKVLENHWLFSGMKPIDFSTKGDGAGTNASILNDTLTNIFGDGQNIIGVTSVAPFSGSDRFYGSAFGKAVLRTSDLKQVQGSPDVAIANSDEPSFSKKTTYPGRSMFFSFAFDGINDNTGYSTRAQVLQRVMQWLTDQPTARVDPTPYRAGQKVRLHALLSASTGVHAVRYLWQVGNKKLKATSKPTVYRFPHAGTYTVRVEITDSLGHVAVSSAQKVRVH